MRQYLVLARHRSDDTPLAICSSRETADHFAKSFSEDEIEEVKQKLFPGISRSDVLFVDVIEFVDGFPLRSRHVFEFGGAS